MLRALELLSAYHQDMSNSEILAGPSTPKSTQQSPYFTPPRSTRQTRSQTLKPRTDVINAGNEITLPPTPISPVKIRRRSKRQKVEPVVEIEVSRSPLRPKRVTNATKKRVKRGVGHDPLTTDDTVNAVLATSEKGVVEPIGKIHLIQVRHDPWKMLVATCLLNVTSGRAARPIYIELISRYPNAEALSQASIPDLTELLYPLGLFNQRAASLVKFSQQYLSLKWPIHPGTPSSNPFVHPTTPYHPNMKPKRKTSRTTGEAGVEGEEGEEGENVDLDVTVFAGAGRYASDSFRIYSDLFPGRGAPERETLWVEKHRRALDRRRQSQHTDSTEQLGSPTDTHRFTTPEKGRDETGSLGVEDLGEYLSEEESEGEEEWRNVRPTDKELRRYLIWRWGLEGIVYDIRKGPIVSRARDKRRLKYLCAESEDKF